MELIRNELVQSELDYTGYTACTKFKIWNCCTHNMTGIKPLSDCNEMMLIKEYFNYQKISSLDNVQVVRLAPCNDEYKYYTAGWR